jgi:hypothetical protein
MPRTPQAPRPISADEAAVLHRALEVCPVRPVSEALHSSVSTLRVVKRCDCGCDTVNFEGIRSEPPSIIADGIGETPDGKEIGLIVFGNSDQLLSLEVFSYDDEPARLPIISSIRGYEPANDK